MQKARRRLSAPTACRRTVSGSLSLPCSGFFPPFPHGTGPLSVFRSYLALRHGRRGFGQDSSCPALLRRRPRNGPVTRTGLSPSADRLSRRFRFLAVPSWTLLQPRPRLDAVGLGSSPFARHYSGNRCFFLFLQVLRCFSSLRSPRPTGRSGAFSPGGSPIRTPTDQFLFADPRGFSQLTASFIASGSLGIPRSPFSSFSRLEFSFQNHSLAYSSCS